MYEIDKPKKNWITYNGEVIAPKMVNNIIMPITEAEAKQIAIDVKAWKDNAGARSLSIIRDMRNYFLSQTDWKVIQTLEQGEELPEEYKTWRQSLRDIPQDYKASDYDKLLETDPPGIDRKEIKNLKHSVWQEPKE